MERTEKSQLTQINKITEFKSVMRKLTTNKTLTNEEKSYILSCAIMFIKHYELDRRYKSYLEFGYYIILKYSLSYHDFQPLYDFSINFGFYPIARNIVNHNLLESASLIDTLNDIKLDDFKNENYIETKEQKNIRISLLDDKSASVSYIAPTSFGKSSIIIEHILKNENNNKVVIVVPTKSLLIQTYRAIRKNNINRKILIHDEMYQKDERFIAIFTQERALRLLDKHDISFDIIYIDEAHNLLGRDPRNILLSRLIRKNLNRNPFQKTVYLSPLIQNSNNLRVNKQQEISEKKIFHNIKEPEIYEYRENGEVFQYNRFVNEFYKLDFLGDSFSYLNFKKGRKNFVYIRSPRKIEMFAKELAAGLIAPKNNEEIQELIFELQNFVHKDFYMIELLSKGVLYLHGKIPDIVKEYLEFKFKELDMLNFVIANSVILEGINLPIDTLFILNTYDLQGKELTNLIGRVNRLDEIFASGTNQLYRLLPPIHFINSEIYDSSNRKMENKIRLLRSYIFEDVIKNPTLEAFDIEKLKIDQKNKESMERKIKKIQENEDLILVEQLDDFSKLKSYLINSGIENIITLQDGVIKEILNRVQRFQSGSNDWMQLDIVEKIYSIFVDGLDNQIIDSEFYRLTNVQARSYYKMHMLNSRRFSLKQNIEVTFNYFKRRIKDGNSMFFMGTSYGEIKIDNERYLDRGREVYVNLTKKTDVELINLAIVKLKIEDDFISHKLNKFMIILFDYKLITEDEYNLSMYGTIDSKKINLIKTGLSLNLITRLQLDNQLNNINIDKNNNLRTNTSFDSYKRSMQGFYRFELDKFL